MTVRRLITVIACNCTCPRWNGCSCFSCLVNLIDFSCYSDLLNCAAVLCKTEEPYCTLPLLWLCAVVIMDSTKPESLCIGLDLFIPAALHLSHPYKSLQFAWKQNVWALNTAAWNHLRPWLAKSPLAAYLLETTSSPLCSSSFISHLTATSFDLQWCHLFKLEQAWMWGAFFV